MDIDNLSMFILCISLLSRYILYSYGSLCGMTLNRIQPNTEQTNDIMMYVTLTGGGFQEHDK
jgi:hypothetical protein